MKNQSIMKTAFLLLTLLGGVSTTWADNVTIPQDIGSYIVLGSATGGDHFASYVTPNECVIDSRLGDTTNNKYYTIGSNQNAETVTLTIQITASEAGDYVFGFKTGSGNGTSIVAITLTKSGGSPQTIATAEPVTQNGNWDPVVTHAFCLPGIETGNYTLTITATKTSGSYAGNFGHFFFHKSTQYTMPTEGSILNSGTHIDLADGTYYQAQYNSDKVVSGLDDGGYMDNVFLNCTAAGYYNLLLNIKDYKAEGTLKATVYDVATEQEETTETITITESGDKTIRMPGAITSGLKRLRFDFTGTKTNGTIFNYQNVTTTIYKYILNEGSDYTPTAATTANVELTRSISVGNWSTIVLPFDMTAEQVTSTFGTNVKLAQFTGYDSSTKVLTMSEATTMNANEPYFIKVAEGEYTSPVEIQGVAIVESANVYKDVNGIRFQGVYSTGKIPEGAYFVSGNNLYLSKGNSNIKPFRAYFTNVPAGARLSFFDDETTSISEKGIVNSEKFATAVYDLQGRRVRSAEANSSLFTIHSSLKPGIYIVNGKRVIIK